MCVGGGGRGAKAVRHDRNFCNFFNLNNFTVSGGVGGGAGGRGAKAVRHDRNFCNFFNLNNFTVSNIAYSHLIT